MVNFSEFVECKKSKEDLVSTKKKEIKVMFEFSNIKLEKLLSKSKHHQI